MAYKEEVAARLYEAFESRRAAARLKRITFGQKELGKAIAAKIGGKAPTQSVISRWMAKEDPSLPEAPTLRAAAEVLGVEFMWILFGDEPKYPSPAPTAKDAIEGSTATLGRGEDASEYFDRKQREEGGGEGSRRA